MQPNDPVFDGNHDCGLPIKLCSLVFLDIHSILCIHKDGSRHVHDNQVHWSPSVKRPVKIRTICGGTLLHVSCFHSDTSRIKRLQVDCVNPYLIFVTFFTPTHFEASLEQFYTNIVGGVGDNYEVLEV